MYTAETDLVTNALGTLVAKNPSGTATYYWLASRYYSYYASSYWKFGARCIYNNETMNFNVLYAYLYGFGDSSYGLSVRPLLTIQSSIIPASGSGTSEDPYVLS